MDRTLSHYRLLERLGAGGMGEVYKAEDLRLKRIVALKFLPPDLLADPEACQCLEHEAQAAAALNHPNIATVYELGQAEDLFYIALEYVQGQTLAEKIRQHPFDLGASLDVAIQIAEALKAAHARGLIHCDVKPANVMLTDDGIVKVLDFGLAKTVRAGLPVSSDSAYGAGEHGIAGTIGYMSPEQARGEAVDARTDIFSLGVVIYEMLIGRRPFESDNPTTTLHSVLNDGPPPLSSYLDDAPLELERIIRKALEKDIQDRYHSADEILSDLKKLSRELSEGYKGIEGPGSKPPAVKPTRRWQAAAWRYRKWVLAAALVASAAAAFDLLQPGGGHGIRGAGLIAFAALCGFVYWALQKEKTSAVFLAPKASGFRGLLPFQEADRDRFFGRDADILALADMVTHNEFRFGVLFGDSGSGKTSLLRAGLLPKLWETGLVPIYCRSYKDPRQAIFEECRRRSQIEPRQEEPDEDYLRRVSQELDATLVIVCDQFEEFFINFRARGEREPFLSFITSCHNMTSLPVKFLLSMRSDFLYLISAEFEGRIPEPLMSSKLYHLRNFDADQAAAIIQESARRAGLPFEDRLCRQVARDLATADTVLPSELQIVGERLQSKQIYTVQAYRRAGGKEPLVHSFLEDIIRASGELEAARLLLRSLISDENTRLTLTVDDIAHRMQRNRQAVERLLRPFTQSRLIREIQEDEPWRYELMHEYVIEKINQITGRVLDATQRANRLLRQYLSSYAVDRSTRIPISKLWFIRRYSDLRRGEREQELFRKSLLVGAVKTGAAMLLLSVVAVAAAAALSVSEEWEGVRLSDGHTLAARCAAFSPDGRLLVTGGEDARVIVWDFAARQRLANLNDHRDIIHDIAFSPDGKWFVTASTDHNAIVWDAARMTKKTALEHKGPVHSLAFSSDGRFLASTSTPSNHHITLWSTERWEKVSETPLDDKTGVSMLISPNKYLLSNGDGGYVWDVAAGRRLGESFSVQSLGNHLEFSPDGRLMVSVEARGYVAFTDVKTGTLLDYRQAHKFFARAVAFSPDGKLVVTAAEDIVIWDVKTRAILGRMEHTDNPWGLTFSPDGRWLISTHGDGAVLLWDIVDRKLAANFNGHSAAVGSVSFSPDGRAMVTASQDGSAVLWDPEGGRKLATLTGRNEEFVAAELSPTGEWVAAAHKSGEVVIWDLPSRQPRLTFQAASEEVSLTHGFAISPSGRWIATLWGVFDSATGHRVADLTAVMNPDQPSDVNPDQPSDVAFSPDERWLVCLTWEGKVFLWEAETWKLADTVAITDSKLMRVKFSPDGQMLVTGSNDGSVQLWGVRPLRRVALIGRHSNYVQSVAFSPDNRRVASASDDRTIALWDVESRSLITRIGTHSGPVLSVAFSPDGRLASGGRDKSARIYTRHRTLWGYRLD